MANHICPHFFACIMHLLHPTSVLALFSCCKSYSLPGLWPRMPIFLSNILSFEKTQAKTIWVPLPRSAMRAQHRLSRVPPDPPTHRWRALGEGTQNGSFLSDFPDIRHSSPCVSCSLYPEFSKEKSQLHGVSFSTVSCNAPCSGAACIFHHQGQSTSYLVHELPLTEHILSGVLCKLIYQISQSQHKAFVRSPMYKLATLIRTIRLSFLRYPLYVSQRGQIKFQSSLSQQMAVTGSSHKHLLSSCLKLWDHPRHG